MALVNAAVELAQRGRKVLAVDFDLEAPGLDTFDDLRPVAEVPGIVDFVGDYLATGQAPEIERFVSPSVNVEGLWVMPSGSQREYAASLGRIDWQDLYEAQDGYLLFEDMKEQWRSAIRPDYVLIDSRTGHTDTCGICTRQLPDAVTLLFFPNEQNLRGLAKVVRDIRAEADTRRKRHINTHYVMSNVPDLDDEDDILQRMLARFKDDLSISPEPHVVHRYDSVALLNQVVFTRDRPKSRLAREYRGIVEQIVQGNIEDKDGALHYIDQVLHSLDPPNDKDEQLAKIEWHHRQNGEVLALLGEVAFKDRDWEYAKALLNRSVELGYDEPRSLLLRADLLAHTDEKAGARRDAESVLHTRELPLPLVRKAIWLLGLDSPDLAKLPAVTTLSHKARLLLASEMERKGAVNASIALLRGILTSDPGALIHERVVAKLSLALISLGAFREACDLLRPAADTVGIANAFNHAMATWGNDGKVPRELFERVVELDETDHDDEDANYLQCMAIAYWAIGRLDMAMAAAQRAKRVAARIQRPTFSCWRYRTVPTGQFLEDTDGLIAMIHGDENVFPQYMMSPKES